MPHVLERCLHGGFWAVTVNALSRPMAVFGLLAWSVIDNAAHAGGALTGELIGYGLCAMRKVYLPLPDIAWRTVFGWWGVTAFGALFGFTVWRLLMSD